MKIEEYDIGLLSSILKKLTNEGLIYGGGNSYESLLSPCIPILSTNDIQQVNKDFDSIWNLYHEWSNLYKEIKKVEPEHWLVKLSCSGLTNSEIQIQDRSINANQIPRYGRIDYINLGLNRKIAEMQWRSGGPGLFIGMSDVFTDELHRTSSLKSSEFNLANEFARIFFKPELNSIVDDYLIINDISSALKLGEDYLVRHSAFRKFHYVPIVREFLLEKITLVNNKLRYKAGSKLFKVNFIHGYDLYKQLPKNYLNALTDEILKNNIWIESPLNFIYRQKWGMALPFMKEYNSYFDEHLKSILCPTILLNLNQQDYSILIGSINSPKAHLLEKVKSIDDLILLPESGAAPI